MRVVWRAFLLGGSAVFLQCSLLAPDDRYFLGGGGEAAGGAGGSGGAGGNVELVCTAALACDAETTEGEVITVGPVDAEGLSGRIADAEPNTTFVLTAGTYDLHGVIAIKAPGVTLRSDTGTASDVVLTGDGLPVLVSISASDVTLQGLTLVGASESAVLVGGGKDVIVERPRLCGVVIEDGGTSFLRTTAEGGWVDCGRVERSVFRLTATARSNQCGKGDVVSGMSIAGGRGWVVSDTEMRDFSCYPTRKQDKCPADAIGVVFSLRARDTLIERSRFIGVSRAIAFGYTKTATAPRNYADDPYDDAGIDHIDGVIRNNLILGDPDCFDTGIELNHARQPTVIHNTVVALDHVEFSAIDRRYTETHADLINNLVNADLSRRESAADDPTIANVTIEPGDLPEFFDDPTQETGFHLKATALPAIDQGVESDLAGLDMDGDPHTAGRGPDVGADELGR